MGIRVSEGVGEGSDHQQGLRDTGESIENASSVCYVYEHEGVCRYHVGARLNELMTGYC